MNESIFAVKTGYTIKVVCQLRQNLKHFACKLCQTLRRFMKGTMEFPQAIKRQQLATIV